jgi:hypothetical protein
MALMGCQPFQQGWKLRFLRSVPLMYQISLIKNLYLVHRNMEEV